MTDAPENCPRLGFVGLIIEDTSGVPEVNSVISEMSHIVVGRMGIPYRNRGCSVITLVVDATTDQVGELTGKLGKISGVSVKSALARTRICKQENVRKGTADEYQR